MKKYNSLVSTIVTFLTIQTNVCAVMELDWTAGFRSPDAREKTVDAGTELIFNWKGRHDVVVVPTKEAFDACDFSSGVSLGTTSGVKTTVTASSYFVCTIPGHCLGGQKLAVTVTSDSMEEESTTEMEIESMMDAEKDGMELDWTEGFRNQDARAKTIDAGTKLIFNWPTIWEGQEISHDVVVLPTKEDFDACDFSAGESLGDSPGVEYTIMETTYFVCTIPGHCLGGQKLAATVTNDVMVTSDGMKDESMTDMKDESMTDMKDESMTDMKDEAMSNTEEMNGSNTESSATTKSYVSLFTVAFTALVAVL